MSSTGEAWYCYEWAIKDSPLERNDAVEPDMAVKTSGTGMAHTDRISASYASSRMLLPMPGTAGRRFVRHRHQRTEGRMVV
jgi:hypothetical protein